MPSANKLSVLGFSLMTCAGKGSVTKSCDWEGRFCDLGKWVQSENYVYMCLSNNTIFIHWYMLKGKEPLIHTSPIRASQAGLGGIHYSGPHNEPGLNNNIKQLCKTAIFHWIQFFIFIVAKIKNFTTYILTKPILFCSLPLLPSTPYHWLYTAVHNKV